MLFIASWSYTKSEVVNVLTPSFVITPTSESGRALLEQFHWPVHQLLQFVCLYPLTAFNKRWKEKPGEFYGAITIIFCV